MILCMPCWRMTLERLLGRAVQSGWRRVVLRLRRLALRRQRALAAVRRRLRPPEQRSISPRHLARELAKGVAVMGEAGWPLEVTSTRRDGRRVTETVWRATPNFGPKPVADAAYWLDPQRQVEAWVAAAVRARADDPEAWPGPGSWPWR